MIRPAIELQNQGYDCFYFIASYHALTTIKDKDRLKRSTLEAAATFLALGLDPERSTFFRQQDCPEVTELGFILNCITPVGQLQRAHAYKTAIDQGFEPNTGLFTYPVLMAADILAFGTDVVPVGVDQTQHIEICKDLAQKFNFNFGETFKIPAGLIQPEVAKVPGLDGRKMGKSYNNTIEIFLPKKQLKKKIMSIVTDSKTVEESKNPDSCNVFNLYKLIASSEQIEEMRQNYQNGGYGYGHAKIELFECLNSVLEEPRERYNNLIANPELLYEVLEEGGRKARPFAQETLKRVRNSIGL